VSETTKRIKVPQFMKDAFCDGVRNAVGADAPFDLWEVGLEAALTAWSEKPIEPTDKQIWEMQKQHLLVPNGAIDWVREERRWLMEWQRIMFLAEPDVPEELADLPGIRLDSVKDQDDLNRLVTELNVLSFQRGIKKGASNGR
jgi:hypothetical protein